MRAESGSHSNGETRPLPEVSERKIPSQAIELVNDAFKIAYPDEFGSQLPALLPKDVLVIKDVKFKAMQLKDQEDTTHSLVNTWRNKILKRFGINNDAVQTPDMGSSHLYEDRPIFVSESLLDKLDPNDPLKDALLARLLIHEHMHRVAKRKTRIVEPQDPLVEQAFFTEKTGTNSTEDNQTKQFLQTRYNSIRNFVSSKPTEVTVEGALTEVKCQEDGIMKTVAISGYDLNEALVEFASKDAVLALINIVTSKKGKVEGQFFRDLVLNPRYTPASFRMNNLLDEVEPVLASIGVDTKDPKSVLSAYREGQVPVKIAEAAKGKFYFT